MNPTNAITPFAFDSHAVRAIVRDGGPWFVAADVCAVLAHSNSRMAVERLDADEKGVSTIDTPGGHQEMTVINESGLYSLVLTSRKPEAKRFKKWITAEVLPAIRKTGHYATPGNDTVQVSQADLRNLIATTARLMEMLVPLVERLSQAAPEPTPRRPPSPFTDEEKDTLIRLLAKGLSQGAIARELGRSTACISKYVALVRVE